MTYIDSKKALDCVQFDVLLHKIERLNIDDIFLEWIKSNLASRTQTVFVNNCKSNVLSINQGVSSKVNLRTISLSDLCQ